jgi:UDP:flavonoid glycosyltransferase YjiC (YdhE family)
LQAFITPILHDTSLAEWVADHPLVCIDFGSMGCMGLLPDPHYLVKLLLAALQKADAKGILLTGRSV